jgi:HD-GYP domain-containing protein (c-di-GMP phosphodiesterase class II)
LTIRACTHVRLSGSAVIGFRLTIAAVHPEVEELKPKLKEILYDCAVEIRATKAALYLFDGVSRYELITDYGFRTGTVRQVVDESDSLIDRCMKGRTPFFVNGLTVEPRFSERLYDAATDRMLAVPMYHRGKLVGVIDSRDKAAKQPFDHADAAKIQKISDRILALFANKNIFGQRFITLSDAGDGTTVTAPAAETVPKSAHESQNAPTVAQTIPLPLAASAQHEHTAPMPAHRAPQAPRREEHTSMASLIMEAHTAVSRFMAPAPGSIGEAELVAAREVMRKMLGINGLAVASLSAFGHMGGVQEIASKSTLTGETLNFLQSKLSSWLAKRGEPAGSVRSNVQTPLGITVAPIASSDIQKVFTAPVVVGNLKGMYLTIGFSEAPDRVALETLAANLDELQLVIENSITRSALQRMRFRAAEKLLEPDFTRYPTLKRHTDLVVSRVEQFLRVLGLPRAEAETTVLAAMVHDVGMRLLDYDRLYRKRGLSDEELGILREHCYVGAALVEPLLGPDVARAVLAHHERMDGHGYPNEWRGEEIPLAARVLQICDAYETMVSPESYQPVDTPEVAMATIYRGAGNQFDGELVKKFVEMLRGAMTAVVTR